MVIHYFYIRTYILRQCQVVHILYIQFKFRYHLRQVITLKINVKSEFFKHGSIALVQIYPNITLFYLTLTFVVINIITNIMYGHVMLSMLHKNLENTQCSEEIYYLVFPIMPYQIVIVQHSLGNPPFLNYSTIYKLVLSNPLLIFPSLPNHLIHWGLKLCVLLWWGGGHYSFYSF